MGDQRPDPRDESFINDQMANFLVQGHRYLQISPMWPLIGYCIDSSTNENETKGKKFGTHIEFDQELDGEELCKQTNAQ